MLGISLPIPEWFPGLSGSGCRQMGSMHTPHFHPGDAREARQGLRGEPRRVGEMPGVMLLSNQPRMEALPSLPPRLPLSRLFCMSTRQASGRLIVLILKGSAGKGLFKG